MRATDSVIVDPDLIVGLLHLASRSSGYDKRLCLTAAARLATKTTLINDLADDMGRVKARCSRRCWSNESGER